MLGEYSTVVKAAKTTSLSEQTIARMLRDGALRGVKVSRDWLIPPKEVRRLEAQYPLELERAESHRDNGGGVEYR